MKVEGIDSQEQILHLIQGGISDGVVLWRWSTYLSQKANCEHCQYVLKYRVDWEPLRELSFFRSARESENT